MAADTVPTTESRPLYRFTADQYEQMLEAGIVSEGTELHDGIVSLDGHGRNGDIVPYRFDLAGYMRMIDLGILREGSPVELIRGEVVCKMTQGYPHGLAVERLNHLFFAALPRSVTFRCQLPIELPDATMPEPDFAVCMTAEQRGAVHPRPEHIFIVVEVADSSLEEDREERTVMYAKYAIPVYWIVNLVDDVIEAYTHPECPAGGPPRYASRTDYAAGQAVPVVIAGTAVGTIPVDAVLPG